MQSPQPTWTQLICLSIVSLLSSQLYAQVDSTNWPQFRGPDGNGTSTTAQPPTEWSADSDNLKWKVELPGSGSSSPIVWGDNIFVMTAVDTGKTASGEKAPETPAASRPPGGRPPRGGRGGRGRGRGRAQPPTTVNEFWVMCLNRKDGSVAWKTKVNEAVPHEGKHSTNTFCSASPVTDGKHVYASFGSFGLYCLDMEGKVIWQRDFGKMTTRNSFGEGASPALLDDTLAIVWDHEGQSFVEVMEAQTGKTVWRKDRSEPSGWATPRIVKRDGQGQVIVNASKVKSYDLSDGSIIWECGGQTGNPIPTPMILDGMAICMTGFRSSACYAIPLDSQGDITDTDKVIWNSRDIGPYVPTGVLYKGQLYGSKTSTPVVTVLDAKTGDTIVETTRLDGIRSMYSSMVAAADHVYITGRNGATIVLAHGPTLDIVATNELGEEVDSTPALVDNQILIRGAKHLFCFEDK